MITPRCTHPPCVVTTVEQIEPHRVEHMQQQIEDWWSSIGGTPPVKPPVFLGMTARMSVVECSWCRNADECDIEVPSALQMIRSWWRGLRSDRREARKSVESTA